MTRLLEGIFVIGCSLVGFAMSAPQGSAVRQTMNCSIHLIGAVHDNITANAGNFSIHLAEAKADVLANLLSR